MKIIKPYKERIHSSGSGIQKLYKFPNGYGASVVRFTLPMKAFMRADPNGMEYGSYTNNEDEWELAVIKWEDDDYKLTYDTPITDDVMGYLGSKEVEDILKRIADLSKDLTEK